MQRTTPPASPPDMRRHVTAALHSLLHEHASGSGRPSRSNASSTQRNAELAQALSRAQRNL